MPPCNKELKIFESSLNEKVVLIIKCCKSENHEGSHEWHIWTDDENRFQKSGKGIIKVIK